MSLPTTGSAPIDEPRGEPLRSPSHMPPPFAGRRRVDHPDPAGLPPPEVKVVTGWRVSCDGGEGAMGHPRVWLSIPHAKGFVDCGYCDARFLHQDFAGDRQQVPGPDPAGEVGRGNPVDHTQPADIDRDAVRGPQGGGGGGPNG